ncbi:hypothetical protein KKG31_08645 [Patescibacteria group bacterium]|nr:hypothetical protein [Patescibacteria group bacterium]MBU1759121.1 hypothetical protein [Patescibacteria group bacterium]
MAEHITEEQKIHIARALNQDIDDRFAGFKHCFTSRGRMYHDHESLEKEKYMDPFCLDQTKIKQSKAFRRLSDKAQVMPIIERESHMRNRQIHTREVEDLASQFCDMINHLFDKHKIPIRVNKELCKSQALGHDIGHAPF